MCGIVGSFDAEPIGDEACASRQIGRMRDSLAHRGPDDAGSWLDVEAGVSLGFRRLSILDLTQAGHQPMVSHGGRFVIVLNGEIYNHAEIRRDVDAAVNGQRWRGHCDTETLLQAIELWGLDETLRRSNGMFALGLWDRRDRVLSLARDRIGKKPLYYGWAGRSFVFASELRALWLHPHFDFTRSARGLSSFMQFGYVLGPDTIFAHTRSLAGGHVLRVDHASVASHTLPAPQAYWRLADVAHAGLEAQRCGQVVGQDELEAVIEDAVACRMTADVPVGVFLSGGVDSSLVTAMMVRSTGAPVRSFAIGFPSKAWDEAPFAEAVAAYLGTVHETLQVASADIEAFARDLPGVVDQPFADDSIMPTGLLSGLARRHVTVALSGDGGDELFAGYQRYASAKRWLDRRAALRPSARTMLRRLIDDHVLPATASRVSLHNARRLRLIAGLLADGDPDRFHMAIMSQTLDVAALLAGDDAVPDQLCEAAYTLTGAKPIDRMTYSDSETFLPDDILAKVDRASMSHSLEVRCPLLDHRIIGLSWRIRDTAKFGGGAGKLPLRTMLARHVPDALTRRPKMGFSAPVTLWLQTELRDWAEALMTRQALQASGQLNVDGCRALWVAYAGEKRGWDRAIWNILMFQAWHFKFCRIVEEDRKEGLLF